MTSTAAPSSESAASRWKAALSKEAHDLAAALAGGAIVGVPLLFTMEMWQHGAALSPAHLLLLLGCTLLLNWGFDLMSGFRERATILGSLSESVTSVAVGIAFSTCVLGLIGELHQNTSREAVGKILVTALVVSVGASFANSQVRKNSRTGDDEGDEGDDKDPSKMSAGERDAAQWKEDLRSAGATIAGSVVFALNVAPTEEILLIAAHLSPLQQLAILGFEIGLGYIIVFASGFSRSGDITGTLAQKPIPETILATALSLGVSAVLIALLGQRASVESLPLFISATVALGLPAVVGGAAGRIIA